MVLQKVIAAIEDRHILIDYDITGTLGDFRQFLINKKLILIEAGGDTWRFAKIENDKITETAHVSEEKYIPVSAYIYDTNTIQVANLKKSLEVFADILHEFFRFDVSKNLRDLRKLLIEREFIHADTNESAWRFLSPNAKDLKDVTEAIIGIESEQEFVVRTFLYGSNKVRMVNTIIKKSPDLIGIGADYFSDGDIKLTIIRNNNLVQNKLAPIMMTNVRPADKHGLKTDFDKVVLCEKETSIGIRISTKTHEGFAFSIKVKEGNDITSESYSIYNRCTTYVYQGTSNAIEVVSHKDLDIPTQQSIGYRRVTVKVWRFISYKNSSDNIKRIVDDNVTAHFSLVWPHRSIRSSGVDSISGDSIDSAAFKEGDATVNYLGDGYITDIEQNKDEVLGNFEIDFFVFKTAQDAQNMVESRINPIYG